MVTDRFRPCSFGIAGIPALWVKSRRTVTPSKALARNSLRYRPTGASSLTAPRSTRDITASVVPSGLVSDAMSKIVSCVIGSGGGDERAGAEGAVVQDPVVLSDQHHGAGDLPARGRRLDGLVDGGEVELRVGDRGSEEDQREDAAPNGGHRGHTTDPSTLRWRP